VIAETLAAMAATAIRVGKVKAPQKGNCCSLTATILLPRTVGLCEVVGDFPFMPLLVDGNFLFLSCRLQEFDCRNLLSSSGVGLVRFSVLCGNNLGLLFLFGAVQVRQFRGTIYAGVRLVYYILGLWIAGV